MITSWADILILSITGVILPPQHPGFWYSVS
jgi:hypothetical protein